MRLTASSIRTSLVAFTTAALVAVVAVPAGAAGAAGAFNASDVAPGAYSANLSVGDFTVHAASGKAVNVDGSDRTSDRGDEYTQRLKLNGSGAAANRSLSFTADGPTQVLVHARSGSGTADRALALYDESWTELARVEAVADDSSLPVATEVFDVPSAGTYWIASPSSGVNVYYVELGPELAGARAAWDSVAAPTVDSVTTDPADPTRLLVTYTGLLGPDGGDIAHAVLRDADGIQVDRAFTAVDGASGVITLSPPASGAYTVEVSLTRSGEADALVSPASAVTEFALPLAVPEISGSLTTAVAGGSATVTLEWGAVAEAESYTVEARQGADEFAAVASGIAGTSAEISGLTPGAAYEMRVIAHRGTDSATGPASVVEVAGEVQRWQLAEVGSNAAATTAATVNEDGTITFDALASSTKFASSEDGFQYFYTQIDPQTENFTLRATFRVDNAAAKDNQSGFGIIAVDDLTPFSGADRYFNSAAALVTRYGEGTPAVVNGTPGARFVTGYTGATNTTEGLRDQSGSEEFDPGYRPEVTTGPKFDTGDVYEFTLRRSNTGFHAIWHRSGDPADDIEVIEYDPDMLLAQNPDAFYVGLATARKIAVTVTDWEFTTLHPDDDEPAQDPPTEYVPTSLKVDVTETTPHREIAIPLVADFYGTGQILDADGTVLVDGLTLVPGESVEGTVALDEGDNTFTARATPAADQPQLGEFEELESMDPVDVAVTVTVNAYGEPGQSLWVAPDGSPDGDGTKAHPLDVHTAVGFAQPGQQIILEGGTYALERAVVVDRGRDGTAESPITLMSEPGSRAVLDLTASVGGGLHLRGDWWHVYDLEITGSLPTAKPMLIQGHHNVVERVESHHNQDTGIQISGASAEPPSMWPSHNLVVSSKAHHNADPGGNDADGFAAKLTVGEGNVFRYSIAHHNIDDGWDLYAKSTTGPIGTVVVEDSVAYFNGWLSEDPTRTGEGNGFKLGGESIPGDHLLRNSVSYGNLATGVTSNSGPDVRLESVTSVDNERGIRLETNASTTAYEATGVISWANPGADVLALKQADTSLLTSATNHFDGAGVSADWFVSTDSDALAPRIAADGSVDMQGLYELTGLAPADAGARLMANPSPTEVSPLPEVEPAPVGPAPWYASAVYVAGDQVQHDGVVYEARWWTRGQEPGLSPWGPWKVVGEAPGAPAVVVCAAAWDTSTTYLGGELVSRDGVNYRALWWTRGQVPGDSAWSAWAAVAPCEVSS
ncbi:carbohydrate-binding protein [Demequina sp.]|uniref:carbohydrate-binding protein n=1 Tax=Demequina sp. TaxID=2050685 RepID=UPI003A899A28